MDQPEAPPTKRLGRQSESGYRLPVQIRGPESPALSLDVRIARFELPPVHSALVVGRRSPIGPKALLAALQEMMPDTFEALELEHEVIQAVIVNTKHSRRIPLPRLVDLLVANTESLIDESETLRVELDIEARVRIEVTL